MSDIPNDKRTRKKERKTKRAIERKSLALPFLTKKDKRAIERKSLVLRYHF
jgi:hypothetical protein